MMNWSALTKKQQVMVIATVVIAVAQIFVLIRFLGGQDASDEAAQSSKKELHTLQSQLDEAKLVIAKREKIEQTLSETVAKLEELSVHIPTESDRYAWAYEYISRRAVKADVALDSLEEIAYIEVEGEDPDEQPYEIRLSTRCGYNQLVEFLWRIESDNPLVRVKDVDISTFPDSAEQHQVRLVLQWPVTPTIERGDG